MICLAVAHLGSCRTPQDESGPGGPSLALAASDTAGTYIVVLKKSLPNAVYRNRELIARHSTRTHFVYEAALVGFSADLSASGVRAVKANPDVAYIEPNDGVVELLATDPTAGWAVGRIDQRYGPSDSVFTYGTTGSGVNIYVIDTGVNAAHLDFGGRVVGAWTWDASYPANQDCHGHGTWMSSIAAGTGYGVAKGATIQSVRTRDCQANGNPDRYVAAINWVAANHVKPAIINISWRIFGNGSQAVKDAAVGAKNAGVFVVAAAGNDNNNACEYSPGGAVQLMTVAATTRSDSRWSLSNYGACVDLFAPGDSVPLAYHTGGYSQASGTSASAAIVSGVAALLFQAYPQDTPDQIHYAIRDGGTAGVVSNPGVNSPNLLVFSQLPAPVQVSIQGPSYAGPFSMCSWNAEVRAGRGPFQFQWSGILTGSQSGISGQVSESGGLQVQVSDVLSGVATATIGVTFDPNYSGFIRL